MYLEAHKHGVYSCCPSWLPSRVSSLEDIDTVWESPELKAIQDFEKAKAEQQTKQLKTIKNYFENNESNKFIRTF